jgi:hypothetical protein
MEKAKQPGPCVKCGDPTWLGPRHVIYPEDALQWVCSVCGFKVTTACLDAKDYDFEARCVTHGTWRCTTCRDRARNVARPCNVAKPPAFETVKRA